MNGRVLVVDAQESHCRALEAMLREAGLDCQWRTSGVGALETVAERDFDAILTDLGIATLPGVELCERILAIRPDVPVIVVTGDASLDAAVAAIRAGAYDFITKPVDPALLTLALGRALRAAQLRKEMKRLRRAVVDSPRFGRLLGESPAMKRVFDLVARVADSEASVLVMGESGTGKELLARAIHEHSRRRAGPFLAVSCAAMPATLLESELFGHVRGAYTDAKTQRDGLFVQAHGGTLFLDEIGELPLDMQPKLLRALQERTVRPVGGNEEIAFDVRIVTATNRDLESDVEDKRFREDLYYRINVIHIALPPLRARGSDVLLLAQHFLARFAAHAKKNVVGLSPPAAERLLAYAWPGNVRELQNAIEHAVALARYDQVVVEDLPERVQRYRSSHVLVAADEPSQLVPMDEVERRYVLRVMQAVRGNKTMAAKILGYDRKTLYRKLERYGALDEGEVEVEP